MPRRQSPEVELQTKSFHLRVGDEASTQERERQVLDPAGALSATEASANRYRPSLRDFGSRRRRRGSGAGSHCTDLGRTSRKDIGNRRFRGNQYLRLGDRRRLSQRGLRDESSRISARRS